MSSVHPVTSAAPQWPSAHGNLVLEQGNDTTASLIRKIIAAWPFILLLVICAIVVETAWLRWVAVPLYTAQMTVAPVVNDADPAAHNPSLGAISSLVGLDSRNNGRFDSYIDIRNSIVLAQKLLENPEVRNNIFKSQWDDQTHQWHEPRTVLTPLVDTVKSILGMPAWSPPMASDLEDYLRQKVAVVTDRRTSHTQFSYENANPAFAADLLQLVHASAEEMMREDEEAQTKIKIAHLMDQVEKSSMMENRQALTELLAEEQRVMMLLSPQIPFAAAVTEPPSVGHHPSSPRPVVDLVLAAAVAAGIGILGIAVRTNLSRA